MASCYVFQVFFFLSLHVSIGVQASRSLDLTRTDVRSSLGVRSLLAQHGDSVAAAAVKPAKNDRLSAANWQEKLLTKQMGSKPPNCDGKCDLCGPCEAVEVPISNRAVQKAQEDSASQQAPSALTANPDDTNYMPESWRCACGDQYYNP